MPVPGGARGAHCPGSEGMLSRGTQGWRLALPRLRRLAPRSAGPRL